MFVKSPKHNMDLGVKIACSLLAVILLALVSLASSRVDAQTTPEHHIYAPLVSSGSGAQTQPSSVAEVSQQDDWLVYESLSGGYSFSYPDVYTVSEQERGLIFLQPKELEPFGNSIVLAYMDYEIDATDDLPTWAMLFEKHLKSGPYEIEYLPADLDTTVYGENSRQAYGQATEESPVSMQVFLITNGRMVLRIFAQFTADSDKLVLHNLVQSIQFSDTAPQNLTELYHPDPPPAFTSLHEFVRYIEGELVTEALNIRVLTGETPTELLDQMSALERSNYEGTLEAHAELLEDLDSERAAPPISVPEYSESDYQSYLESEREHNQSPPTETPTSTLSDYSDETSIFPDLFAADALVNCGNLPAVQPFVPTTGLDNRKGLPSRFLTPIRTYGAGVVINCGSYLHVNADTYAADIGVGVGTQVWATAHGEWVYEVKNNWNSSQGLGYGNYIKTYVDQLSAGGSRRYYQIYAHLQQATATSGQMLDPNSLIATSGCSGLPSNCPAHLHFAISTLWSGVYMPVDLSPMKGLRLDLDYPAQCALCGSNRDPNYEPIIIEANEFQVQMQPASGHSWTCSTYLPTHTGTCYRAATPITPHWGLAPINGSNYNQTPRITYQVWLPVAGNYYAWVCAMGGSADDDSLHMSLGTYVNGVFVPQVSPPSATATDMHGYNSTNWIWFSQRMDYSRPYLLNAPSGYNYISVHARENGLRIDRILLTRDVSYNPVTAGVRCAAAALYN